jgi:hypothetical protein
VCYVKSPAAIPNSKQPTVGACRLCHRVGPLRRSHVLSEMAYEDVIDASGHPRTIVVRDIVNGRVSDKTHQTGFWERLLCDECEGKLSRYEAVAARHLFNRVLPTPVANTGVMVKTGDYSNLKLFLLSILWRAGIANGDFFRCVRLGPHEERLREMVRAGAPGEPDEYGCLIMRLIPEDVGVSRVVAMPFLARLDDHNCCVFVFRGFAFQFFISRHRIPESISRSFLNERGDVFIPSIHGAQLRPLRDLWNRSVVAIHREAEMERRQGASP